MNFITIYFDLVDESKRTNLDIKLNIQCTPIRNEYVSLHIVIIFFQLHNYKKKLNSIIYTNISLITEISLFIFNKYILF